MAPLMGRDVLYAGTVVTEHREDEDCTREKQVGFEKSQKGWSGSHTLMFGAMTNQKNDDTENPGMKDRGGPTPIVGRHTREGGGL
jgi:hypothetical protein